MGHTVKPVQAHRSLAWRTEQICVQHTRHSGQHLEGWQVAMSDWSALGTRDSVLGTRDWFLVRRLVGQG